MLMSTTVKDFLQPDFFVAFVLKLGLIKPVAVSDGVLDRPAGGGFNAARAAEGWCESGRPMGR